MDAAVWGFIGVVIGGAITIVAEIIRTRHESSLDGAKRIDDRRLARDAFQRENLLDLQERLAEYARAVGKITLFDRQTVKDRGQLFLMGDELSTEFFSAQRQLNYRMERVKDDGLRTAIDGLMTSVTDMEGRHLTLKAEITLAILDADTAAFTRRYVEVSEALGAKLREYL